MWPLGVLLLWALVCAARGNVQEEIFTRPGSDLLLPIRRHLTLNHEDGTCDEFEWKYKDLFTDNEFRIARLKRCKLNTNNQLFTNTRISENGSLIIDDVTLHNDGIYRVDIHNSRGDHIQTAYYIIHVEGNINQMEIFTRPGSDLLLPIRLHLTLNHEYRTCDEFYWTYKDHSGPHNEIRIARHTGCKLTTDNQLFPNTRISENGSLIIDDVTPHNDGIYRVDIYNSTRRRIQTVCYIIHVEVPVSVPVLNVSCLQDGRAEISCRVEEGTKLNISVSVIGGSQGNYSASSNNITAIVGSPGPWSITCYVENRVSCNMSKVNKTCPVPLSHIKVTSSCLPDGSAKVDCSVNGSDPRYSWTINGISVSNESWVTLPPPASGTLRCDVTNEINNLSRSINIYCPVPLSHIEVTSSCLPDGSAKANCSVNGSDPRYSWTMNGRSVSNESWVTLPPPASGTLRCDVTNQVNNLSRSINIYCPVPLSGIEVTSFCLSDGSAKVDCSVNGSDPRYFWAMNGRSVSNESWVTLPPPVSGTLRCDVTNQINNQSKYININCSEIQSHWGHLLSHGVVFVLYTGFIIYLINELMKMKNERNQRMRKDMEMEPTYYNERN